MGFEITTYRFLSYPISNWHEVRRWKFFFFVTFHSGEAKITQKALHFPLSSANTYPWRRMCPARKCTAGGRKDNGNHNGTKFGKGEVEEEWNTLRNSLSISRNCTSAVRAGLAKPSLAPTTICAREGGSNRARKRERERGREADDHDSHHINLSIHFVLLSSLFPLFLPNQILPISSMGIIYRYTYI
jgi:hypothetical protein